MRGPKMEEEMHAFGWSILKYWKIYFRKILDVAGGFYVNTYFYE